MARIVERAELGRAIIDAFNVATQGMAADERREYAADVISAFWVTNNWGPLFGAEGMRPEPVAQHIQEGGE